MMAWDDWVKESNPDISEARLALSALRTASLEIRLKGKRLASIPLLLQLGTDAPEKKNYLRIPNL
jgi:hypothetical protein